MDLFFKTITIFFAAICLCSCKSPNQNTDNYNLPAVYISCNPSMSLGCQSQNEGKDFYVGLTSNLSADCEQVLYSILPAQIALSFDFHSKSKTTFNGEMEGAILKWYDAQSQISILMENKNYIGCSFIDINSNGQLDPSEPYSQLTITPQNNFPTFVDWKN